jgi:hypothetical protein
MTWSGPSRSCAGSNKGRLVFNPGTPPDLGFLLALEHRALPAEHRMRGARRFAVTGICLVVMVFGLYMLVPTLGL